MVHSDRIFFLSVSSFLNPCAGTKDWLISKVKTIQDVETLQNILSALIVKVDDNAGKSCDCAVDLGRLIKQTLPLTPNAQRTT